MHNSYFGTSSISAPFLFINLTSNPRIRRFLRASTQAFRMARINRDPTEMINQSKRTTYFLICPNKCLNSGKINFVIASSTPAVDPGIAKTSLSFAIPATARDIIALLPIC